MLRRKAFKTQVSSGQIPGKSRAQQSLDSKLARTIGPGGKKKKRRLVAQREGPKRVEKPPSCMRIRGLTTLAFVMCDVWFADCTLWLLTRVVRGRAGCRNKRLEGHWGKNVARTGGGWKRPDGGEKRRKKRWGGRRRLQDAVYIF